MKLIPFILLTSTLIATTIFAVHWIQWFWNVKYGFPPYMFIP